MHTGNKCSVAANGITPINLNDAKRNYANTVFNIPENKIIVVTTGRASLYKGIDFYIECANELINNQAYKHLHFLFCGNGPDIATFKALTQRYKLNPSFTFAGKRTDIRQILPSCDIGFHAATGEVGYSLSILEYMSAGLVTIVPDQPSTSLCIKHKIDGLLYSPRNLQSATDAIKAAIDKDSNKTIRDKAILSVQTNYNITLTNKKLLDSLDSMISK